MNELRFPFVSGIDTWFIVDRKPHVVPLVPDAYLQVPKATLDSQKNEANDLALDLEENVGAFWGFFET